MTILLKVCLASDSKICFCARRGRNDNCSGFLRHLLRSGGRGTRYPAGAQRWGGGTHGGTLGWMSAKSAGGGVVVVHNSGLFLKVTSQGAEVGILCKNESQTRGVQEP